MVERLTTITGGMFSGKTDRLIALVTRAEIAGRSVQVFKPDIDLRYGAKDKIVSHSKSEHVAILVKKASQILPLIDPQTEVVAISEVQFFDESVIGVVKQLLDQDIEVVVEGLPLDFKGEPFGPTPILLAMADRIERLTAICDYADDGGICGEEATRTQRIVDGQPANYRDPVVFVGGRNEGYFARCPNHHIVPGKPLMGKKIWDLQISNLTPEQVSSLLDETDSECALVAQEFLQDRDFAKMLGSIRNLRREQAKIGLGNPDVRICIAVTDHLSKDPGGNEFILQESKKLGVLPLPNYHGERVEAASCLYQLIQKR